MRPERRDTPRIAVTLEVMLRHDRFGFQPFRTRDISLDGVFVETGQLPIAQNSTVDLAIKLPTDGAQKVHRFHAQTVHVSRDGVGLSFDQVNSDGYAALLDLVFSRQPRGVW